MPGPGDVLVQVEVALTDGTDAKAFRRGHPVLLGPPPSPFGHEFSGIDVATGRRVVAANSAPCGDCAACDRGEETLCENLLPLLNGAYAELIVVPERIARRNLLPVPPALAPEVAALVEPLACCLHGVDRAGIEPGDSVAILGAGPIGLMLAACVADAGGRPFLVGGRAERRELAPLFGAKPAAETADVVIEAAGTEQAWRDAVALARPGGTVVFFGGLPPETEVAVDAYRLHYEELTPPRRVPPHAGDGARGARVPRQRRVSVGAADHAPGRTRRRRGVARRPAARLPEGCGQSVGATADPSGRAARRSSASHVAMTSCRVVEFVRGAARWRASIDRSRCDVDDRRRSTDESVIRPRSLRLRPQCRRVDADAPSGRRCWQPACDDAR